ncbi:Mu transposase C-terminal domain-containing protein [Pseudomonas sp. P3C3]
MTQARFSISALRDSGLDIDSWPEPEIGALSAKERALVEKKIAAVKSYFKDGLTLSEIKAKYGITKSTLYRLIERGQRIVDGQPFGFLGAMPYVRTNPRKDLGQKLTDNDADKKSGIFCRLLNTYPSLNDTLSGLVDIYRKKQKRISDIHQVFLDACRGQGIADKDYPFSEADFARRTFETHLKAKYRQHQAETELENARRVSEKIEPTEALDEVEVDGHQMDLRLVIEEYDLYGEPVRYEILRVWLILVIDVFTRCVLGYSIALGRNYDQQDVLSAIFNALAPHARPKAVIKNAPYEQSGGFPSERGEEFAWATWRCIKLDNALSHKAIRVKEILDKKVGCLVDYGPPHQPNARSIVERFFRFITDNFSHRVIGTTGSSAKDPVREALSPSSDSGLSLLMTLDELRHAIDIVLSDYNGRPHSGVFGNTPLELFTSRLAKRSLLIGRLKSEDRNEYDFMKKVQITTVRSSSKETGAYINFANVKYKDPLILRSDLAGRKIQITYDVRDVSHVRAYTMDGKFIGALKASGPWGREQHSLLLRQTLFKAFRDRTIRFKVGQSLLDACNELRNRAGKSLTTNTAHYEMTQSLKPQQENGPNKSAPADIKPLVKETVAMPLTKVFVS